MSRGEVSFTTKYDMVFLSIEGICDITLSLPQAKNMRDKLLEILEKFDEKES